MKNKERVLTKDEFKAIGIFNNHYAGSYRINGSAGLGIYLSKKPKWIQRKLMFTLLGWEWIDNKPNK
jgi:hypothetical protein